MGSAKASLTGGRVQVIINGAVQFDQHVDEVDVTSTLHTSDNGLACEMQFAMKYGYRKPDGSIIVGDQRPLVASGCGRGPNCGCSTCTGNSLC